MSIVDFIAVVKLRLNLLWNRIIPLVRIITRHKLAAHVW